jgi:hypothetical protein
MALIPIPGKPASREQAFNPVEGGDAHKSRFNFNGFLRSIEDINV